MTYRELSSGKMLEAVGDDAVKWADAFLEHNPDCRTDHDVLVGWFANAIENSTDVRRARLAQREDHAELVGSLRREAARFYDNNYTSVVLREAADALERKP
jgi:hypothetical protein